MPIVKSSSENERFDERVIGTPPEPSSGAALAVSSSDDRRELRVDDHEQAEDTMIDQNVEGAISGGMDLDVVGRHRSLVVFKRKKPRVPCREK